MARDLMRPMAHSNADLLGPPMITTVVVPQDQATAMWWRRPLLILTIVATSLPMFMATLDNLVLTTALPVIRADLDASIDQLAWF
jgi:hypothetical protein